MTNTISPEFLIKSTESDYELAFSRLSSESHKVELRGADLFASTVIWGFPDFSDLSRYFCWLGIQDRPWATTRRWQPLERDFSLAATCSSVGKVTFQICIGKRTGGPEEWSITAHIQSELGQLESLAQKAKAFFHEADEG